MMCPSRGLINLLRSPFFWALVIGICLSLITFVMLPYFKSQLALAYLSPFTSGVKVGEQETKKLIIGVLSAQNHFEQRQVVRRTWGTLVPQEIVDLKFILGSEFCSVPPVDRVTPYLCEEWTPALPDDVTSVISSVAATSLADVGASYVGFTFIVKQNISVHQLSITSNLLTSADRIARVVLIDAFLNKIVASATFAFDPDARNERLRTKNVGPVRLPINFEGEFKIISSTNSFKCPLQMETLRAVHVFEVFDSSGKYVPRSKERDHLAVCGGFSYTIEGDNIWKNQLESKALRAEDWNKNQAYLKSRLAAENELYGDIVFAEVVDVYANLVQKTIFFLEWASTRRYDFVLKTDDDVFLDVSKIVEELQREPGGEVWDWWSCFKVGWSAPNAGKWRDRLSPARTYPPFPSGSGYVIRMEAVLKMLSCPSPDVPVGEDVAVGLLASGLNLKPLQVSSCYWSCNENCSKTPCNAPELNPELMTNIWASYKECKGICNCLR